MARVGAIVGAVVMLAFAGALVQAQFANFGRGIDIKRGIFDGVLSSPVITLSNNNGRTWYSPITRQTQNLPDQLEVSSSPGVTLSSKGYDVKDISDYQIEQHRYSGWSFGIGFLGFGKSKEAGSVKAMLDQGGSVLFVAERSFNLYDVAAYPYDLLDTPARRGFVNAVNNLPQTCNSQEEKDAYRSLMTFFGTHYFTQATYGGNMKYLISTKSSYVYRKTMSYVIKQVSFFIGILDFGLKFNSGSNTTEIRIDEEFMEMSTVTLVLNGGTHSIEGSNLKDWLRQVVATPALIKATLRPLNELIADDAKAACLSTSINAYLSNDNDVMGKRAVEGDPLKHTVSAKSAVQWAMSQMDRNTKKRSMLADLKVEADGMALPGAGWIGMGIDGATMQPAVLPAIRITNQKASVDTSCSSVTKCGGCWTNPFAGVTYNIPDQMCWKPQPEFLQINGTQEINKVEDLKYFYEKVTKKKGFLGLSSKTETYRRTITNQMKRNEAFTYFYVFLQWYEISLPPFPPPSPNPIFQQHYQSLPASWNADPNSWEYKEYRRFIDYWGTHYVDSAVLGGAMKQETWFHKCFLSTTDNEYRSKQSKSSFIIVSKKSGDSTETNQVDQKWQDYSRQSVFFEGGRSFEYDPTEWQAWLGTIYENPTPLSWGLTDISTLLPNGAVRSNLAAAIADYLAKADAEARQLPLDLANQQNPERPPWCTA